jgi:hypothetical protein
LRAIPKMRSETCKFQRLMICTYLGNHYLYIAGAKRLGEPERGDWAAKLMNQLKDFGPWLFSYRLLDSSFAKLLINRKWCVAKSAIRNHGKERRFERSRYQNDDRVEIDPVVQANGAT